MKIIECDQDTIEDWIAEKRQLESDATSEKDKDWNNGFRRALEVVLGHWGKT